MPKKAETRMTLDRFLVERQHLYPHASGEFTRLMAQIGTASKIISNYMRRAALEGLLGSLDRENVQGEQVKLLDELGNQIFLEAFEYVDIVGVLVSEEMTEIEHFTGELDSDYAVMVDPVDGSGNIDVNGIIGSIFSIHRLSEDSIEASCLKPGRQQVAAGYIMYGPSTVLVYTAGNGVHAFILDENIGEFVLQKADVKIPEDGPIFSANLGYYHGWSPAVRGVTDDFLAERATLRYSGALLADLHAILHRGGVYYYPGTDKRPEGKLRLLYECNPLAYLAEQAGGAATNGPTNILDLTPEEIHQRTPLFIGSRNLVDRFRQAELDALDQDPS